MVLREQLLEICDLIKTYGDVTLVAATKTRSVEEIAEVSALAPATVMGENRAQELVAKYDPAYTWHMIGQLQTNKVKYIIDKVALIHSLDRAELAKEIDNRAMKIGKVQACLVEVNMGAEESKGGVTPSDTIDFIKSLREYEHIRIEGLMSVMPNIGDTPKLDEMYAELKSLYDEAKRIEQPNADFKYLSAGMTNDYKTALRHGANMIRVGRAIFGERK